MLPAQPREAARLLGERFGAPTARSPSSPARTGWRRSRRARIPPTRWPSARAAWARSRAIAHGLADNLIERAADVMLKERRPLVLVPRETPLSVDPPRQHAALARAGAVIVPPAPGF